MDDSSNNSAFWAGKRVLVTGASGFIGSHLTEALAARGASVRAFVRYNSRGDAGFLKDSDPHLLDSLEIVMGDLRDPQAMLQAARGMQVVFHLGALIAIPYSYLHPYEVAETNVMGTLNVLAAALEAGVERMVHTSTSEVYGTARSVPIDEAHPLQGQSPYSASKIGADKLAEAYHLSFGLPVVTIRPFNTFGPRQSARAVIPTIITQALTQTTIRLGSTDTRRDFTYIEDTVSGFLRGAEAPGVEGGTYNLGTGREVTIAEVVELVVQKVGRPVIIETDPERLRPEKSEVLRLLSDNSLAGRELGWSPQIPFEEGIGRTIAWISEHLRNYRVGVYER
jgi:dTDP-glucose 4,6-dehydratase